MPRWTRWFTTAVPATAALLAATSADAQAIPFAGCTSFAFDVPAPAITCGTFQSVTLGGYTFENATFSGVTATDASLGAGTAFLTGAPNGIGAIEVGSFGAFYSAGTPFDYTGRTLFLRVQFTAPGPGEVLLVGTLNGPFDPTPGTGTPLLTFAPGVGSFGFVSGSQLGTLSAGVDNYALGTFAESGLRGVLTVRLSGVVPEPSTVSLVALGLAGVLASVRRRAAARR